MRDYEIVSKEDVWSMIQNDKAITVIDLDDDTICDANELSVKEFNAYFHAANVLFVVNKEEK